MSSTADFLTTAESATALANCLLDAGERQARKQQIPSLLELQTICRESGSDLAELNVFARVRDNNPALLLCGGTAEMATEVARQIGYTLELPHLPDAPLVWCADGAAKAGLSLRHANGERTITPRMLVTFLQSELNLSDFVFIEERVAGESPWRFMWVPYPAYLEKLDSRESRIEILLGQQAAISVTEDAPETLTQILHQLEQKWWAVSRDEWAEAKPREHLLAEIGSLMLETEETRELRAISLWQFLAARLLQEVERRKQEYQTAIDQHEQRVKYVRYVLGQYQRNWVNGVQSVTDAFLQQRMSGKTIAEFMDPQKPGPDIESFLSAVGLQILQGRIEQFITDRMADFVGGLDGFAAKLELRRISLGEMNGRWTPRGLGSRVEGRLRERRIFVSGGGKRGGLMAKVTGKTQGIVDQRKGQLTQACQELSQAIAHDFAEWCTGFTSTLEQNIRIQLAAALANQGLPDPERLQGALPGFDRLSDRIRHHRDAARTSEDITAEWLRLLASRRWIPLYQSRPPVPSAR